MKAKKIGVIGVIGKAPSLMMIGRTGMAPGVIGLSTQVIGQEIGLSHLIQPPQLFHLHCQVVFRLLRFRKPSQLQPQQR